jgi:ribonucleoside-diphosphate reductase subunit M1
MFVTKRDGTRENVHFDKITSRINKLIYGLDESIDPPLITQKIISRIYSGIKTTELDELASQVCMGMIIDNHDFGVLGSRLTISNHQKNTKSSLYDVAVQLMVNRDVHGNTAPLMSDTIYEIISKYQTELEAMIDYDRDYLIDYFGFKTLERSYLLKVTSNGKDKVIVERPQHLFMRVAIGIHGNDLKNVQKTYDNMSLKRYTHATPTLFNASSSYPAMSSCFLLGTHDSIEGIFQTITDCANISKWSRSEERV